MSLRKQTPSDFLKQIIGRPVVVKLNSGVDYRGVLACLDGYMNIALEQTEEYVNGQLKNKYGDAFIRGNNVSVRSSRHFMGFLLQARTVADHQIAGTFVFTPRHSKQMACFEEADTVTHSDKSPKRKLLFMWKAPGHAVGDIRFLLSVVESYFVYWTRIESSVVSQQTHSGGLSANLHLTQPRSQAPSPQQRPDAAEGAAPGAEDDSILDTALSSIRVTKLLGDSESLSQPLSHASTVSSNGQRPSGESSSTLRSFLGVPKVERLVTPRKGSIDSFVSISGTQHRTKGDLSYSDSLETSLALDEGEQAKMTASNRSVAGPTPHTAHSPKPPHIHSPETFTGNGAESTTPTPDVRTSGASRSQADSARASDCSLYESKHREHRVKDAAAERGAGCLSKTSRRPEVKLEEGSALQSPSSALCSWES